MREINLNGYIDDEVWFGDEITPDSLHETLYEPGTDQSEDVHIRLNSYGGSCNAAVRMHDDLVAYPGKISITISGTAASAATVLAMAADTLEMTPGSLFMIHDPIVGAIGNEADLMEAIGLLRACKDSIINVYATRTLAGRDQIAQMMKETTWMDAEAALAKCHSHEEFVSTTKDLMWTAYEEKIEPFMKDFGRIEKTMVLKIIDAKWIDHIDTMSKLREGIHLRSYAQDNPLKAYTSEGYEMFENMMNAIATDVVNFCMNCKIEVRERAA